jgi:hypothetical protein
MALTTASHSILPIFKQNIGVERISPAELGGSILLGTNHLIQKQSMYVHVKSQAGIFSYVVVQAQFGKASQLTGSEFLGRLDYYAKSWLPARSLVSTALAERMNIDASGKIVVFDQFAPWKVRLLGPIDE